MFGSSTRYGDKIPPPPALRQRLTVAETRGVRSKLKAAAYGMEGVDWHKLFNRYDRNTTGHLGFHEFKRALRGDAKISVSALPNSQVHHLFNSIDTDGGGTIDVEEFITWVEDDDGDDNRRGTSARRRHKKISSGYGRVSPTEMSSPSQRRFDLNRGSWLHNNDEHSTAEGAEFRQEASSAVDEDDEVDSKSDKGGGVKSVEKAIARARDALQRSFSSPIVLNMPPPSSRGGGRSVHGTPSSQNSQQKSAFHSPMKGGRGDSIQSPLVQRLRREKEAQDDLIRSQAEQLKVLKLLVSEQFDAAVAATAATKAATTGATRGVNTEGGEEKTQSMMFTCQCHCGANRARFEVVNKERVVCWECNCSDCSMRRNLHFILPKENFVIEKGGTLVSFFLFFLFFRATPLSHFFLFVSHSQAMKARQHYTNGARQRQCVVFVACVVCCLGTCHDRIQMVLV